MREDGGAWRIERHLGGGGLGEAYLAKTPEGGRVVVKVLSPSRRSQGSILEKEFLLLTKIRHPSVVSVLGYSVRSDEIFGDDRGPCYWMEYVEGHDLLSAAKGVDPKTIFQWLTEGLEALRFLHTQGILHGDLAPGNVLIDTTGHLKLLDFGVTDLLGVQATVPYMAPERIDGRNLPVGDLFSLGTLFYEAIAGVHPRAKARSLQELMERSVRPLAEIVPTLSSAFSVQSRVVDRLIEVDPSRRFSRAEEALTALTGGEARPKTTVTDYHSIKMIGTEGYFDRMARILKGLRKKSALVCLHGITGVGKKQFVREIGFQCAISEIETKDVPPERFKEMLTSLKAISSSGTKAYFFRSLDLVPPEDLLNLTALRQALPRPKGLLIVLDWNDDRLKGGNERFFETLLKIPHVLEIRLENLSRDGTLEFLRGALGDSAEEAVGPLFERTSGNPLLLQELTRSVLEKQASGRRSFSKIWLEDLSRLRSVDEILLERVSGADEKDRKLLNYLAVAHEPVERSDLFRVLGDQAEILGGLTRLMERSLVGAEPGTGLCRLALDSLEEPLLKTIDPSEIEQIHRAWIAVLQDESDSHPQKLHHALALRDKAVVKNGALTAAEKCFKNGQTSEALELVDRAVNVLDDPSDLSRLLRLKMNFLNDMGRFQSAIDVADEWIALRSDDEPALLRTVKYWFMTGLNHQNLGNHEEAGVRLRRCLEKGDEKDPAHRPFLIRAHSLLGKYEMDRGDLKKAREQFQRGLDLAGPTGRRRAELCRNLAECCSREGDWAKTKVLFDEARHLYGEDRYEEGEFAVYLQEGNLALTHDDPERASACYSRAEEIAVRRDDRPRLALVWHNQSVLARKKGELAQAIDLLTRAEEIFRLLDNRRDLTECLKNRAIAEASVGRFERATDVIVELEALGTKALAQEVRREVSDLREGNTPETREELERLYRSLPPELQVSFVERGDYKKRCRVEEKPKSPEISPAVESGSLEVLTELNRQLLVEEDMDRVLKRLMDSALRLTGAENGFLILRGDRLNGPLPGFDVAVARKISKKALEKEEYSVSLSAVRRAMESGEIVVTDNALEDPLFRNAKSIHLRKLRSVLALPVAGKEGIIGVFYLDHPLTIGLFAREKLPLLKAFAGIAASALQKGKMIEELKRANTVLSEEIEIKTSEMGHLRREVKNSRLILKNQYTEIVGRSPKMLQALSLVDRITDSKVAVWIYGESGTGKEAIARALHFNSGRAKNPFVSENCSAMPESLLESELFGHKKGAFTHAVADKKGILAYADGGTIFLDEIADMSQSLQAKLLRFLQEGEIRPIGSHQVVKVDVRVVSASNRDLAVLVDQGKFREDLFFRLNGVTVTLPPLRERLEDLPLLADHFLEGIAEREKRQKCSLHPDTLRIFMTYAWPGNVRELQNTLETAVLFAEETTITPKSLEFKPALLGEVRIAKPAPARKTAGGPLDPDLERILRAIRDEGFHRGNAAKALGMSRRNLYAKLERFGVPRDQETIKDYVRRYLG